MIQLKCQCGAKFSEQFALKHKFEGMDSADKKLFDKLYILSIIILPVQQSKYAGPVAQLL